MSSKPRFVGEKQPLENRVDYVRGVTYKAAVDLHEELDDNSYVLLRANNIQDGELRFDDVQYVDRAKVKQKQLLRRGDILFCASSGSKGLVGKAALVRENMPVTFGAFCCVLRPKENEAEYLAHYFQSQQYRRAIEKVCSGSNINNLKAANFFSLVVPHYDDDSTRVISALFDSIDAQIKHAKDQIANLDPLVKSRFVEMFGDPALNPMKWDIGTIESYCDNLDSRRVPITQGNRVDGPYPYIGASGVVDHVANYLFDETLLLISEDGANLLARTLPIAFTISGKAWVNNHAHVLRCRDDETRVYLQTLINMLDISLYVSGSAQPKLSQKQMNRIPIMLPSRKLLVEFAAFAVRVDKSRFIAQQQIEKLQMLYDSLAQDYFGD